MDDTEIETRALTFKQLAELLDIQWDSARKLVRRMKWRKVPGNELANLIMVPVDFLIERGVLDPITGEFFTPPSPPEPAAPEVPAVAVAEGGPPTPGTGIAEPEPGAPGPGVPEPGPTDATEPQPEATAGGHAADGSGEAARIVMAQLLEQVAALRNLVYAERGRADAESSRAASEAARASAAEQDRDRWHSAWTEASKPWWQRGRKVA